MKDIIVKLALTVPKEMRHGDIRRMVEGAIAARILESIQAQVRPGGPTSLEAACPAEMVKVEDISSCGRLG